LRPQRVQLLSGEQEHEVLREPLAVASGLLVDALGGDPVEGGKLGIEQYPLATHDEDSASDVLNGHDDGWSLGMHPRNLL
jgi:hypothetical protein